MEEQKEALLAEMESKCESLRSALSGADRVFCEHYAIHFNASNAMIAAGFSENCAAVEGSKRLRKPNIMPYIDAICRLATFKKGITKEEQIWRLQAISQADIQDYVKMVDGKLVFKNFDELTKEQSYAIESVKMGKNGIELKLNGKNWAIEMLNKNLGFYEEDNKQKGEGLASGVAILLPDNKRGKVVPNDLDATQS